MSRFEKAKKKKLGGHELEFDMPSRSNRTGSVANNLGSSVFARPGQSLLKEEDAAQILFVAPTARTDDDLQPAEYNLKDELGGLTDINVMNDLIKELKE